ncbi:MAG: gluconokinase [Devosia sp.]|nr:gluconokinase [Devosia sp.]
MRRVVVMGVSGCGKSTLGEAIADHWGLPFIEGDSLHSSESVAKMAVGVALEDRDRWPWLDRVGAALRETTAGGVASCSALRRVYRDRLRNAVGADVRFVMLDLPRDVLAERMKHRPGHYMPAALLDSQLQTLERPDGEGDVLVIDGTQTIEAMVRAVTVWPMIWRR